MKKIIIATALLAIAVLTGCAAKGSASTPPPSSSTRAAPSSAPASTSAPVAPPPSRPTKNASYGTVVELRDAAIAAGYSCPNWAEDDMLINAAQSGNCSDDDVFATYASQSSRDAQIAQTKDNNATLEDSGVPTSPVLFGPNWSINAPATAVTYLRAALGGIVVGG